MGLRFFTFGVGMLLLSTEDKALILLLAGALIGLGFGNISSTSQTIAVLTVVTHRMRYVTATFFFFWYWKWI